MDIQQINRPDLHGSTLQGLAEAPVVALLGARQVGKTTLARRIATDWTGLNRANAVGDRPLPEALRALILDICRHRDWTTPAELARWFDMHRRSLATRYIRPLLEADLLERRYPDRPNTPKQAYRTRRPDTAT